MADETPDQVVERLRSQPETATAADLRALARAYRAESGSRPRDRARLDRLSAAMRMVEARWIEHGLPDAPRQLDTRPLHESADGILVTLSAAHTWMEAVGSDGEAQAQREALEYLLDARQTHPASRGSEARKGR